MEKFNKIKGWWSFASEKELHIRAAALSYYSLIGIIPLLAGIILFFGVTQTNIPLYPLGQYIFPSMGETVSRLGDLSQDKIANLFSKYTTLGIIAVSIIAYSIRCFLINIQQSFNYIWKSEERSWRRRELFNVSLFLFGAIVLVFTAFVFNKINNSVLKVLFLSIVGILVISVAFYRIPYDKRPRFKSAMISSILVIALLWIWKLLLPLISDQLSKFDFEGIQVFLLVFYLFVVWYICIIGAKICRTIDKSDYLNMREKIEQLAPCYELFLSIFTMANIIRKFSSQKYVDNGLSFREIQKGMFVFKDDENKTQNTNVELPMPLLDRIVDNLRHQGFLDIVKEDLDVKYVIAGPRESSFEMSVSDFLFQYFFHENFDLGKPYQILQAELESKLSTSFFQMFRNFKDIRLKDMYADKILTGNISVMPFNFDTQKSLYEKFKSGRWEDECEQNYRNAYEQSGYDFLRQSILDHNELSLSPGKQFHLDLIEKIHREHQAQLATENKASATIEQQQSKDVDEPVKREHVSWWSRFKQRIHKK